MPTGVVNGLGDFTIALWINPAQYDRTHLSDARANADQATLYNGTAVFDFGQPNPQFAEPALARMYCRPSAPAMTSPCRASRSPRAA